MKNKKYAKIKEKFLFGATSSIIAGVLFVGANTAFADVLEHVRPTKIERTSPMHLMRRWNSVPKINALATQLGLDVGQVREELKSGKTLKQILQENGVDIKELHKAFKK